MASLNQAQQVHPVTVEEPKTPGQISGYESFYRMFNITKKRLNEVSTLFWPIKHIARLQKIKELMQSVENLMQEE